MKTAIRLLAALLAAMQLGAAQAEISLPEGITDIEESAFEGCAFDSVCLPQGTLSLGERTFADNPYLERIVIPDSVSFMADTAFDDCPDDLLIVPEGDYALSWAISHGFDYGGGSARVLIVVETYEGDDSRLTLYGTATDGAGYRDMFAAFSRTSGSISLVENPDRAQLLSLIPSFFGGAGDTDLSVFVFLGHGERDTASKTSFLAAYNDTEGISASQLRSAFSSVGGRKVIIIDACYSGGLITDDDTETQSEEEALAAAEEFAWDFVRPFSFLTRSALTTGGFYIITACSASQQSFETSFTSGGVTVNAGFFSYYFNLGCGWDEVSRTAGSLNADSDENGIVTLAEIASYTDSHLPAFQTLAVYPSGMNWFGLFRND